MINSHSLLIIIFKNIFKLSGLISEKEQLKELCGLVSSIAFEISRIIRIPDNEWLNKTNEKIDKINTGIRRNNFWLTPDISLLFETIINDIKKYLNELFDGINSKVDNLDKLIGDYFSSDSGEYYRIFVPKTEDVEPTKKYLNSKFPILRDGRILVEPISEYLSFERTELPNNAIICGWLGREKMISFMNSNIFKSITLLLYRFEKKWFGQTCKAVKKQTPTKISNIDFNILTGFNDTSSVKQENTDGWEINDINDTIEEITSDYDIKEFELKLKDYVYSKYSGNIQKDSLLPARLVNFTYNKFSFITDSKRLILVNDIMEGRYNDFEIQRKNVEELKIGDYILIFDSDRDIIREIADKALNKQSRGNVRNAAGIWRSALIETYDRYNGNIHALRNELEKSGCKRNICTLKNWLFNDDIIGPKSEDDLIAIAATTKHKMLEEKISEVREAISIVRGAHLQAARYLIEKLVKILPSVVNGSECRENFKSHESSIIEIEEFGKVHILRILEICNELKNVEVRWVNRLLEEE